MNQALRPRARVTSGVGKDCPHLGVVPHDLFVVVTERKRGAEWAVQLNYGRHPKHGQKQRIIIYEC